MADVKEIADLIGKEIAGTGQLNKREQDKLVAAIRRLALDAFAINRIVNYSGGSAGGGYTELNRIRRYPYDGGDVVLYPINRAGLLQAFSEAGTSDTITIPPATLPGDYTIPANIMVMGAGSKSTIFSGQVTGASGAYLRDCAITRTDNSSSNLIGLVTPASGTFAVNTVAITITQSGSGAAYALSASGGGDIKVRGCYLFASSGSGSGYAVLRSSGNVYLEEGCELSGSTSKTSGSNIYDLSFDPEIHLHDSAGAFKVVFSFTAAGLTAALAAATSGDVVSLPPGTVSGNNTVPAGVALSGIDRRKTILSGQVTLGDASVLANLSVTRTANDANALYGVLGADTGETAYIINSDVTCTQSGSGTAAGLALQAGNVETWLCNFTATSTSGSGYGMTAIGTAGSSQTIRSYDISGVAVDSSGLGGAGSHIDNPTTPITGSGGDCAAEGTSCHIHDDSDIGVWTWIIYDLGGIWTGITNVKSRMYRDGDFILDYSTAKSSWISLDTGTYQGAAETCSTKGYSPSSVSFRYLRYQVDDVVLVGDKINLAWFELTGTSPTTYGTGTYYYTRFSGNTKDLDGTNGTANVYACQYQTYNGTPVQMWGDRSAWDTTNYGPRHADDWAAGDSHHPVVTLAADADTLLGITGQELNLDSQDKNTVLAGPASAPAADPTFRALVAADIPQIAISSLPDPLGFKTAVSALVISSDAVTVTQSIHTITSETGTTDNLATINGGTARGLYALQATATHTITVKHGTGNIYLNGAADFSLTGDKTLLLFYDGTNWSDLGISGAGAVATDTIWDALGDLAGGTGANTAARLAVGTNGQVLVADSGEATGMKWVGVAWTSYQATSTIIGWDTRSVNLLYYMRDGNRVYVEYNFFGVSNATTISFTLPYTHNGTADMYELVSWVQDNSATATSPGLAIIPNGSATVTVYRTMASGGWTNINNKGIYGNFWYYTTQAP